MKNIYYELANGPTEYAVSYNLPVDKYGNTVYNLDMIRNSKRVWQEELGQVRFVKTYTSDSYTLTDSEQEEFLLIKLTAHTSCEF